MNLEIFADRRWILIRAALYFTWIMLLLVIWNYFVKNELSTIIIALALFLFWFGMIYVQKKVPLIKIGNEKVVLTNAFYLGVQSNFLNSVSGVRLEGKKIILDFAEKKVQCNMTGMSSENLVAVSKEFQTWLHNSEFSEK